MIAYAACFISSTDFRNSHDKIKIQAYKRESIHNLMKTTNTNNPLSLRHKELLDGFVICQGYGAVHTAQPHGNVVPEIT